MVGVKVHPTAEVHSAAVLGFGTVVWAWSQIRENVTIGSETSIGQGCYVGPDVIIGARCKIQNSALIYEPAVLGDAVFVGPGVVFTNDRYPRAVNLDGSPKKSGDWEPAAVVVEQGASIGARAVLVGPVTIGEWATIGAGAVVSSDVKPHALVLGNPARQIGWMSEFGEQLDLPLQGQLQVTCSHTGAVYQLDGTTLTKQS
jgi:acetyltransferase-like isoleucine patch superfamily enzyme